MNKMYASKWKEAVPLPRNDMQKYKVFMRDMVLNILSNYQKNQRETYLRCLYCHYVFDDQKKEFEEIIIELKKIGKFIDTDTCLQMLLGHKEIDKRYFHLSFDDGFRNIFTNAFPILKKYDVPAMFFVPSSLIGADWEMTRKYCLRTTNYRAVIEMVKWDDLKEMISEGYEIGSHTKTHTRFSELSANIDLMQDEIIGSKKELENNLKYNCKYISWPYGRLTDIDEVSLNMVNEAGYVACFGGYRGSVIPRIINPMSIPRHHFEVQWPLSHIKYFARGNMEK